MLLKLLFDTQQMGLDPYRIANLDILGDLEVTANIYCKSRNLLNTDMQNYSTDLR